MTPSIEAFFHEASSTLSYIVWDPETKDCAVIDSVLDYDQNAGRTATTSAEAIVAKVRELGLTCQWVLETHVHADHLSAAPYIKAELGGTTAVGDHIPEVQRTFKVIYNAEPGFHTDGTQFECLFADGETFTIGNLQARVIHTPGHTPACVTYVIEDCAFVGDTLFMPDFGTARADFPGGDARTLYHSIQKILALPPETHLFTCHDYQPGGRDVAWESTVAEQRENNVHVGHGTSEADFVKMRTERDSQLPVPQLLIPSIQVNMRAGEMPPAEDNGVHYLKIPVNKL